MMGDNHYCSNRHKAVFKQKMVNSHLHHRIDIFSTSGNFATTSGNFATTSGNFATTSGNFATALVNL